MYTFPIFHAISSAPYTQCFSKILVVFLSIPPLHINFPIETSKLRKSVLSQSVFFVKGSIKTPDFVSYTLTKARQFLLICDHWHFPLIIFASRGNKCNNWISHMFLHLTKQSTDTLMNEMQPVVFEKCRFVFRRNQINLNFWLYRS